MESREFVIPLRRRWTLWILPVIALLYFAFVIFLAISGLRVSGVETELLVLAGAALFGLVLLVQLPFLFTRRPKAARAQADESPAALPPADPYAGDAVAPLTPTVPPPAPARDDEMLVTAEEQRGMRVLEYSAPAKSTNRGAVYTKTYVPVTKEHVLRIETMAADRRDL